MVSFTYHFLQRVRPILNGEIAGPPSRRHLTSTTPSTLAMILPEPTYIPPDLKKKPHAKKQPPGHIPRPRNPFILFRCDYVRQKKIPAQVEKDHRNISRIVGQIWRQMNDKQKEPWILMADKEKVAHSKLYPSYRFATGTSNRKSKRGDDVPQETQKPETRHFGDDSEDSSELHRSSSCPPGNLAAKFCGPRINVHPYPAPGPNDPLQWDVAPIQPHTWTDWSTFQFNQSSASNVSVSSLPL